MGKINNQLRWSKSRASTFADCKRKYYLRYYQHWGGWEDGASEISRLAYRLGKMATMATMTGSAVHEVLAAHFRGLKNGQFRELRPERPVEIMRRVWIDAKKELWKENPKKYPPLFEIYYDRVPDDDKLRGYAEKARRAIKAVMELPIYPRLKEMERSDILWVDPAGGKFSEQVVFNVPPYEAISVPDLIFREGDTIVIVDWKTGRVGEQDHLQMEAGAIWSRQRLPGVDGPIRAYLAYLSSGENDEFVVSDEDSLRAEGVIKKDMEAMAGYLKDPERNIPLSEAEFPRQKSQKFCNYCEFQEICYNPIFQSG
ncbi:MAG: PD-(D/E)XK nuclease family protein [Candidatus Auribacterota bacterium]|nr:PD-(D/E)XK nuclease family protein [Candidatus Auribacterota bacterium]